jgi:signal transduction histidine kinase
MDLATVVAEAAESFTGPAAHLGITLEVEASQPLPVEADAKRVAQVLFNLLGNALKFTPAGGRVRLRAWREDGQVLAEVADTGAGVEPEDLGKLFQPFVQLHAGKVAAGTGLGLYICKGIVEQHDGRIAVASDGAGKGTRFWFALPGGATPMDGASEPQGR